jgi:hypothetical protein
MALGKRHVNALRKLVAAIDRLIANTEREMAKAAAKSKGRPRRKKKDVAALRRLLRTERKRGASAATLAKRHKISVNYVYLLIR